MKIYVKKNSDPLNIFGNSFRPLIFFPQNFSTLKQLVRPSTRYYKRPTPNLYTCKYSFKLFQCTRLCDIVYMLIYTFHVSIYIFYYGCFSQYATTSKAPVAQCINHHNFFNPSCELIFLHMGNGESPPRNISVTRYKIEL